MEDIPFGQLRKELFKETFGYYPGERPNAPVSQIRKELPVQKPVELKPCIDSDPILEDCDTVQFSDIDFISNSKNPFVELSIADVPVVQISKQCEAVHTKDTVEDVYIEENVELSQQLVFDCILQCGNSDLFCDAESIIFGQLVDVSAKLIIQHTQPEALICPVFDGESHQFRVFDPGGVHSMLHFVNHMQSNCYVVSIYVQHWSLFIIRIFTVTVVSILL